MTTPKDPRHVAAVKALHEKFGLGEYFEASEPLDVEQSDGGPISLNEIAGLVLRAADCFDPLRNPKVQTVYSDRVDEDRRKKP